MGLEGVGKSMVGSGGDGSRGRAFGRLKIAQAGLVEGGKKVQSLGLGFFSPRAMM